MKTLVLYSSKHGCTEDCAKYLASKLNSDTELVNLKNKPNIDLGLYDLIIIGSPIYLGRVRKEVRGFCVDKLHLLLEKQVFLFICCNRSEKANAFFAKNYPIALINHAEKAANFGGELRYEKMGFLSRSIMKSMKKRRGSEEAKATGIRYDDIESVAALANATIA